MRFFTNGRGLFLVFSILSTLFLWVFQPGLAASDPRQEIAYPGIVDTDHISWFVQVSDIHIGKNDSAIPNLAWIRDTAFPAIEPDSVVATGDLTESVGPFSCCFDQSEEEWNDYFSIINQAGFSENFYDLPGNHDRYGDPEWDGATGNDGYAYKSLRGPSSDPQGQFFWTISGNYFIAANTCDETGESIPWTQLISDRPQLSNSELNDLEARLIQFHNDPAGGLAFLFGHHSIFTRPGYSEIPGLYDPDIDEEDLNARGAEDFIDLLNTYQVSAYIFGHTHENQVFLDENVAGFDDVSALQVDTGSLVNDAGAGAIDSEVYRIVAIDNHGVSTTTANLRTWPVILITSPLSKYLENGGNNPYDLPISTSSANPIRALGFGNSASLQYKVEGNGYNSGWNTMEAVEGIEHLYQGLWDSSSWPSGTYTISVREDGQSVAHTIDIDVVTSSNDTFLLWTR